MEPWTQGTLPQGQGPEIPTPYEDIDQVMANPSNLVKVLHRLKQVG